MTTAIKAKPKTLVMPDTLPYEPGHAAGNGNGNGRHAPLVTEKKKPRRGRRTVADILNAAADLLVKHGWTQNYEYKEGEGYCLLGAVQFVVSGDAEGVKPGYHGLFERTWSYLEGELPAEEVDPTSWNDARGRTKRQVVAFLRRAAKTAAS